MAGVTLARDIAWVLFVATAGVELFASWFSPMVDRWVVGPAKKWRKK